MGGWWWALVSPDGVAPNWMVGVYAFVDLPLHQSPEVFFWHRLTQMVPGKGPQNGCGVDFRTSLVPIFVTPFLLIVE